MNISLDFDETYTRDPKAWNEFISLMQSHGHNVYCVTFRHESEGQEVKEALANKVDGIFFTGRLSKRTHMYNRGIDVHVWIDDMPQFIVSGLGLS